MNIENNERASVARINMTSGSNFNWKSYFGSLGDFILASARNDSNIVDIAGMVQCVLDGKVVTVRQLLEKCESHGWNSTIYEAWIYETGNQVRKMARMIPPIQADALMLYGKHFHNIDVSYSEAIEALQEALCV